ncbi:MAG: VPLPA-CTERM sorting domain-containing protein [Thermodesulfobacteriota bacterium]
MKKIAVLLGWLLVLPLILTGPVQASTLTFYINTPFPDNPDPDGPAPWLTALFEDQPDGKVQLTLSANLSASDFVSNWYFNVDPSFQGSLSFQYLGGGTDPATIYSNPNPSPDKDTNLKADGDGYFDFKFTFPTSEDSRFEGTESYQYLISSDIQLYASFFNFPSAPGGGNGIWHTAAHIQGISGGLSAWVGDGPQVPIPGAIWLLGSGLLGLAALRRRQSN